MARVIYQMTDDERQWAEAPMRERLKIIADIHKVTGHATYADGAFIIQDPETSGLPVVPIEEVRFDNADNYHD